MSLHGAAPAELFPVVTKVGVTGKTNLSIVVHSYSNKYFVLISEKDSQSVGTIIQVAKFEKSTGFDIGPAATVFDISIRFGKETPELLLAARVLAQRVNFDKPVLFGLAIRNFNKDIYEEISKELNSLIDQCRQ